MEEREPPNRERTERGRERARGRGRGAGDGAARGSGSGGRGGRSRVNEGGEKQHRGSSSNRGDAVARGGDRGRGRGHESSRPPQQRGPSTGLSWRLEGRKPHQPSTEGKKDFKLQPFAFYIRHPNFRHQHDMRKWVLSALCELDRPADVIMNLAREEYLAMLRQVLQCPFTTRATDSREQYSFERVCVPLCILLTSPSFVNSPLAQNLRQIYSTVAAVDIFFYNVVRCVKQLSEEGLSIASRGVYGRKSKEEILSDAVQEWNPSHWSEVLKPVVDLFYLLLTRATRSFLAGDESMEHAHQQYQNLLTVFRTFMAKEPPEDDAELGDCNAIATTFLRIHPHFAKRNQRPTAASSPIPSLERAPPSRYRPIPRLQEENSYSAREPPGELRVAGPRHDNDKANFREISIVPTEGEMLCSLAPYLPLAKKEAEEAGEDFGGPKESMIDKLTTHLDRQFRLLREDCLRGFRNSLVAFVQKYQLKEGAKQQQEDALRQLLVYRNLRVEGLRVDLRKGECVIVSFDQLQHLTKANNKESLAKVKQYWNSLAGSRKLQLGSLVCLALGVRPSSSCSSEGGDSLTVEKLYFATIKERNVADLCGKERCKIGLTLLDPTDVIDLVALSGGKQQRSGENILLQLRGHFFPSYEAVMEALCRKDEVSFPFAEVLIGEEEDEEGSSNIHPLRRRCNFLSKHTEYDLSLLYPAAARKRFASSAKLLVCPARPSKTNERLLEESALGKISLDVTQCRAMAAALARQVTLIQGPPGTGKTYVGVQIVLSLLHNSSCPTLYESAAWRQWNRSEQMQAGIGPQRDEGEARKKQPSLTPILCICYTNHALDQFLEGLLDGGVSESSIVRAGGRSNSDRLQHRFLHDLAREVAFKNPSARGEFGRAKAQFEAMEIMIQDSVAGLLSKGSKASRRALLGWLERSRWDEHYEILFDEAVDEDGFKIAGGEGAVVREWLGLTKPGSQMKNDDEEHEKKKGGKKKKKEKEQQKKGKEKVDEQELAEEEEETDLDLGDLPPTDEPMRSIEELLYYPFVWQMTIPERRALWSHWHAEFRLHARDNMERRIETCREYSQKVADLDYAASLSVLQSAQVVGFTTTGCAKYQRLLEALGPRVIICEEAGEVLESHILASLASSTQALILVGDHQQLRPKVEEHSLSRESGGRYDLDISLFERLVEMYDRPEATNKEKEEEPKEGEEDTAEGRAPWQKYLRNITRAIFQQEEEKKNSPQPQQPIATSSRRRVDVNDDLPLVCTLNTQRRMRPEIADLIRSFLYPNLIDGENVKSYPPLKGFARNLWFLDHTHQESKNGEDMGVRSFTNRFEAEMVVALVRHAVLQGYQPAEIAVLTPYLGQLLLLRTSLAKNNVMLHVGEQDEDMLFKTGAEILEQNDSSQQDEDDQEKKKEEKEKEKKKEEEKEKDKTGKAVQSIPLQQRVRLATVDNFQGEEAELVIVSTVRCNPEGNIGFLKHSNRVNVMISRAKHGMILLGSSSTVHSHHSRRRGRQQQQPVLFARVLNLLEEREATGPYIELRCERHPEQPLQVENPNGFPRDGGCHLPCGVRLPACGHVCPRLCHPDDPEHKVARCEKPCTRLFHPCEHPCPRLCYQDCGSCQVRVKIQRTDCGHDLSVYCGDLNKENGREELERRIKCFHLVTVEKMALCGHENVRLACWKKQELEAWLQENEDAFRRDLESGAAAEWATEKKSSTPAFFCSIPCGRKQNECDHPCQSRCGECIRQTILKSGTLPSSASSKEERVNIFHHAGTCRATNCDRPLFCGHRCQGKNGGCHPSGKCPPCSQPCLTRCIHSQCNLLCKEACSACAEPCAWSCPHEGRCPLPCGSPCGRLPCDKRCEKRMSCGHQCPGVCGEEPCPSSDYCRECILLSHKEEATKEKKQNVVEETKTNKGDQVVGFEVILHSRKEEAKKEKKQDEAEAKKRMKTNKADQVVDLLMMTTLADHDPNESPLVVLSCGHAFTIDTLDGLFKMEQLFYHRDARNMQWTALKPTRLVADKEIPSIACPHCRAPISAVRRYGRALNCVSIRYAQRKFLTSVTTRTEEAERAFNQIEQQMSKQQEEQKKNDKGKDKKQTTSGEPNLNAKKLGEEVKKHIQALMKCLSDCVNRSPTRRVFEMERAHLAHRLIKRDRREENTDALLKREEEEEEEEEQEQEEEEQEEEEVQEDSMTSMTLDPSAQPRIQVLLALLRGSYIWTMLLSSPLLSYQQKKKKKLKKNEEAKTQTINVKLWLTAPEEAFSKGREWAEQLLLLCQQVNSHRSSLKASLLVSQLHLAMAYTCDQLLLRMLDISSSSSSASAQPTFDYEGVAKRIQQDLTNAENLLPSDTDLLRFQQLDPSLLDQKAHLQQAISHLRQQSSQASKRLHRAELLSIFHAMGRDVGTGVGSFGGHWFECPNGHVYTIGECGGAMQRSSCPECGEVVGGGDHRLAEGNRVAERFLTQVRENVDE
ncbi:NFX1-type zinc finger-containing protein 1 [Balamuthia mandrillaris]